MSAFQHRIVVTVSVDGRNGNGGAARQVVEHTAMTRWVDYCSPEWVDELGELRAALLALLDSSEASVAAEREP